MSRLPTYPPTTYLFILSRTSMTSPLTGGFFRPNLSETSGERGPTSPGGSSSGPIRSQGRDGSGKIRAKTRWTHTKEPERHLNHLSPTRPWDPTRGNPTLEWSTFSEGSRPDRVPEATGRVKRRDTDGDVEGWGHVDPGDPFHRRRVGHVHPRPGDPSCGTSAPRGQGGPGGRDGR